MTSNCYHEPNGSCALCSPFGLVIKDGRPTFERCADPSLDDVRAIYAQRGTEYADSWAVESLVSTFSRSTLRLLGLDLTDEQIRLLQAAALVDVKDSRMGGPFKEDSVIDGLAYRALWLGLVREYQNKRT